MNYPVSKRKPKCVFPSCGNWPGSCDSENCKTKKAELNQHKEKPSSPA